MPTAQTVCTCCSPLSLYILNLLATTQQPTHTFDSTTHMHTHTHTHTRTRTRTRTFDPRPKPLTTLPRMWKGWSSGITDSTTSEKAGSPYFVASQASSDGSTSTTPARKNRHSGNSAKSRSRVLCASKHRLCCSCAAAAAAAAAVAAAAAHPDVSCATPTTKPIAGGSPCGEQPKPSAPLHCAPPAVLLPLSPSAAAAVTWNASSCEPTMDGTTTTFMPAATAPCPEQSREQHKHAVAH
jgi:hypothetical protein